MPYYSNIIIPLFESYCRQQQVDGLEIELKVGSAKVKAKVASTPESRAEGYSGKPKPKVGEGMLFILDKEEPQTFWMKGVNFPLDIIFFDAQRKYVSHETMEPSQAQDKDLPRFSSSKPAQFALEVPSGWCKKNLEPNCNLEF